MLAYLQGLSLGLAYVAPIGVQNLFVINAGLSQPRAAAYRIFSSSMPACPSRGRRPTGRRSSSFFLM